MPKRGGLGPFCTNYFSLFMSHSGSRPGEPLNGSRLVYPLYHMVADWSEKCPFGPKAVISVSKPSFLTFMVPGPPVNWVTWAIKVVKRALLP